MINADSTAHFATNFKGEDVTISLVDGTEVTGAIISVNSKGLNLKVDGKVRSFGLKRIDTIGLTYNDLETTDEFQDEDDMEDEDEGDEIDVDEDDETGGDHTNEEIYAMLEDGMTTAQLAAVLSEAMNIDLTPKELRVHLRALGLGVGKGRKYSLTATEYRMLRDSSFVATPGN